MRSSRPERHRARSDADGLGGLDRRRLEQARREVVAAERATAGLRVVAGGAERRVQLAALDQRPLLGVDLRDRGTLAE
jgi:hypothetical protein